MDVQCGPHSIGRLLSHINKYTRSYLTWRLLHVGIDGSTYGTMLFLFRGDGVTEKEIARHMLVDKATTTRTITKLEVAGFVKRERDQGDRRAYRVYLTDKALEKKGELLEARKDWIEIVLRGFSDDEREMLLDMLVRMECNLQGGAEGGD
ncbi:MAG: MarR family transcriptional regulator [Thermoplasmatota archaeon]